MFESTTYRAHYWNLTESQFPGDPQAVTFDCNGYPKMFKGVPDAIAKQIYEDGKKMER